MRLRQAALALFSEHGYEATTVDDVAAAAGVTQRTFFRHFVDKEEVLFEGDLALRDVLLLALREQLRAVPINHEGDSMPVALGASRYAFRELARTLEEHREEHRLRAGLLNLFPTLRARQLLKQQRWADALVDELVEQGVDLRTARTAVTFVVTALQLAYDQWAMTETRKRLTTLMGEAENSLRIASAVEISDDRPRKVSK